MDTELESAPQVPARDELLRYAQLAIRDLQYCGSWAQITPPLQMALRVIHESRGARGHGVLWKGRVPFEDTGVTLAALREEAQALRREAHTFPGGHHLWNAGGAAAKALGQSLGFKALLQRACGRQLADPMTHYNYYEQPSHCAYPHIDIPESHLNTVLMLRHDAAHARQSRFIAYPYGKTPLAFDLEPGELVLFWGGATVHERTQLVAGESVQVLSVGYAANQEEAF